MGGLSATSRNGFGYLLVSASGRHCTVEHTRGTKVDHVVKYRRPVTSSFLVVRWDSVVQVWWDSGHTESPSEAVSLPSRGDFSSLLEVGKGQLPLTIGCRSKCFYS